MKRIPFIIFGAGNVGRALVRQLLEAAPLHAERDGLILPVVAWCDRDGAVVDTDGLAPETLRALESAKAAGTPLKDFRSLGDFGSLTGGDLEAIVDVAGADGCIVADVTASDATVPALELALRRGYGAVTANKIPLTGAQATFDRLAGNRHFRPAEYAGLRYESTVGSAVPVIETLHGLLRAADRVDAIRGVFSGTLGFICTGLQSARPRQAGQPFSALVGEAMRRGYTESDPRVDLGGVDVARKALILARTLGWKMELSDVAVNSLIPAELTSLPFADFLARLPELDADFAAQVAAAAEEGKVLRYVAELKDGRATVGMQAVPLDTALGRLRGNDNLVAFHTRYYPDEPLVLQGRGAGADAAAAGVHSDIVALAS